MQGKWKEGWGMSRNLVIPSMKKKSEKCCQSCAAEFLQQHQGRNTILLLQPERGPYQQEEAPEFVLALYKYSLQHQSCCKVPPRCDKMQTDREAEYREWDGHSPHTAQEVGSWSQRTHFMDHYWAACALDRSAGYLASQKTVKHWQSPQPALAWCLPDPGGAGAPRWRAVPRWHTQAPAVLAHKVPAFCIFSCGA